MNILKFILLVIISPLLLLAVVVNGFDNYYGN